MIADDALLSGSKWNRSHANRLAKNGPVVLGFLLPGTHPYAIGVFKIPCKGKKGFVMKWNLMIITAALLAGHSNAQWDESQAIISDASAHPVVATEASVKRFVVKIGPNGPSSYHQATIGWNMVSHTDYFSWFYRHATPSVFPEVDRIQGIHFVVYDDNGAPFAPLKFPPSSSNHGYHQSAGGPRWLLQYDNDGWVGVNASRGWNRMSRFRFLGGNFDDANLPRGFVVIEHF